MTKKMVTVLTFLLLVGTVVFAADADQEIPPPKNTITVDAGSAASKLMLAGIINLIDPAYGAFLIGTAAQYERQITEKASAALRFEYGVMDMSANESKWFMSSITAEAHGRYYPNNGMFFLDGTLGYAYVFTDFSTEDNEIKPVAHFVKFGGKVGLKIDFGKPRGFILEPAAGLSWAIGSGIKTGYEKDLPILGGMLNWMYDGIAIGVLVGGLQFSLGLGYRF